MSNETYQRLLAFPEKSFFLFGPRGTGKTTWVAGARPFAAHFDLLDEGLYQRLLADGSLLAQRLNTLAPGSWVWIDEVQRLPFLLNEVHRFIEAKQLRFALSGSSSRKLHHAGVNFLAGRALSRTMFPFLPEELGADFDFSLALRFGTLPIVWMSENRKETLQAYVQTYLKDEIQAEALVRNLPGFARFLPIAALFHGQTINVSGLARDAGVARTTVTGYLEILEQTYLTFRVSAYEPKLRVRERKHPKLYWSDPGLVRAIKRQFGPLTSEEAGPLLEGWVAALLRAYAHYRELYDEMYVWAPAEAHQTEVDFLLERNGMFLALEVKAASRVHSASLQGLRAIAMLPKLQRRILIYQGVESPLRTEEGIEIWNLATLLENLAANQLWE